MLCAALSDRLDGLIDELILDGGVEAASLASILLIAKDAVKKDYHVILSRRVWTANNELQAEFELKGQVHSDAAKGVARPVLPNSRW